MNPDIFKPPHPPLVEGIYRALDKRPGVPLGQKTNFSPLTAAVYEPLWRKRSLALLTGGAFSTERELGLMLELLKLRPGQTVLDAACSAGLYARTLLKHEPSLEVHALDFSLPFLKKAQQYAERDGVEPVLVLADVRALPYKDEVFDAIVCGGSLNEFTDLPQTLREFARVLKPGGKMWQMYLSKADSVLGKGGQGLRRASGIRFIDPQKLEEQAAAAGLELVRAQYRGRVALALFEA
ncbi:methyltransferase domain-containing protein [soil metagenome]